MTAPPECDPSTIPAPRFDAYAVLDQHGPHVTLQAGVVHLGRHWTTTSRRSVKAAEIRRRGRATATLYSGTRWRAIGGRASLLDAAHPSTLIGQPVNSALAGGAMVRLGIESLDQMYGYAKAGSAVPLSFLPTGRVLLVTRIDDEMILEGEDVISVAGSWNDRTLDDHTVERSRASRLAGHLHEVPDEIATLASRAGHGWLGVTTPDGAVALPVQWDPTCRLRIGRAALTAVGAQLPGRVCVTLDESSNLRPDKKIGVMLRGRGAVVAVDETAVTIALRIQRVTHWCGFASRTSTSD